ncbi:type III restriction-modification system endonuclease [Geotoga petraea]|jgi:type III restriction enzyme|uniref:Type III restriction-modification system endonuclease n=1 Tax=Geotoga petraea TaxID=28234 RepID=A0A4Z0VS90_9BACT|nr:type III restriction-modification system endonuclease [Geotoga petraea]TGG86621.1 type III restriction-modification system endonuclease [Geotoga petraea]
MAGFNFEKNLEHQDQAVKSTIEVFDDLETINSQGINKKFINPFFDKDKNSKYVQNIGVIQEQNGIERRVNGKSNIIDIAMETGTGKTYTYTKTIFELNKRFGIFKFIVVVPTLAIKAGTIDFLKSDSSREHFKEQYGKTIKLHIVESKKNNKSIMPQAVNSFVKAGIFEKNKIQVLIINKGMINASTKDKVTKKQVLTLGKRYDNSLFDKYSVPFEALAATKPFMIIDEPHKFDKNDKAWKRLQKMKPQFIIRYGATFKENENLVYNLTAVDSFNRNLIKGVEGHITEFNEGKNAIVKFTNSDGKEAIFHLLENNKTKTFKIAKKESLEKVHPAMKDLLVEKLNKTKVVLSNGLELKKGDKLNPYSYAETLQETMIQKAIKHHFEIEKKYLSREVKIKPLTLFFIDNIEEYRNKDGYIKKAVENYIKAEVEQLLKKEKEGFYKKYLEKTLEDISQTHGGYFAVDKKETDEVIEKEVNEILHDKQAILNLDNPRRFIFSKWTLREGWDNPNIFQICKLRSSGSEISKLQEVGRGLRLPVNEYGNRVKDEQFYLNYFVDFTENDFVEKLVNEINEKSGTVSNEVIPEMLTEDMVKQLIEKYNFNDVNILLQKFIMEDKIIDFSRKFLDGGFDFIKQNYPLIFEGVNSNKVRKAIDKKKKITIRTDKYSELKDLWEKLNEKVVLEYKIQNENEFKKLFVDFLKNTDLVVEGAREKTEKVEFENEKAIVKEEIAIYGNEITPIPTMKYGDFLKQLASTLNINMKTIHECFITTNIDINKYLNQTTLRIFKQKFDNFLMYKAFNKFSIEYQKVKNTVHPTKFTHSNGKVKNEVNSSEIGVFYSDEKVPNNYLFDELFYDSELEKENIKINVSEVTVFTKIPKNSIKIPVAGGKSYSPDFAYIIHNKNGDKKLHFIVETKDTEKESIREEEKQKIKHAEKFFDNEIKIIFKTQFKNKNIVDLIKEITTKDN